MKPNLILLAAFAAFASAPALGAEDAGRKSLLTNLGIVAGGVVGAAVGGPPGAIAGMAIGGVTTDRELALRRNATLEARAAELERERRSLKSERMSLKARLDELDRELRLERELSAGLADPALIADGLEFAVSFRTSSAEPAEPIEDGLEALAGLLAAVPSLDVRLDGYTDPRGSDALNLQLSLARAESVRDRLVAAGIDPRRVHVAGHGASAEGGTESADPDGWALQRRVVIRVESGERSLAAKP
jgi:outer membrane protein OmpA-like peptidoglycan-associated protein